MDKMQPCPFCGSDEIGHIVTKSGCIIISCIDCGARGPDHVEGDPEQEKVWVKAYGAWNRRA